MQSKSITTLNSQESELAMRVVKELSPNEVSVLIQRLEQGPKMMLVEAQPAMIKNCPLTTLLKVFTQIYPNIDFEVWWMEPTDMPMCNGKPVKGFCSWEPGKCKAIIGLNCRMPFWRATEILGHELAHAVVDRETAEDPENADLHRPEWRAVYDKLFQAYVGEIHALEMGEEYGL